MGGMRHREGRGGVAKTLQFDDPINIQFTSGTTRIAQGRHADASQHSQQRLLCRVRDAPDRAKTASHSAPLDHCFGMVMGNLASITSGATMVYPGGQVTLQTVAQETYHALRRPHHVHRRVHQQFSEFDLSSLRTGIMAGAPCPIEVMCASTSR